MSGTAVSGSNAVGASRRGFQRASRRERRSQFIHIVGKPDYDQRRVSEKIQHGGGKKILFMTQFPGQTELIEREKLKAPKGIVRHHMNTDLNQEKKKRETEKPFKKASSLLSTLFWEKNGGEPEGYGADTQTTEVKWAERRSSLQG